MLKKVLAGAAILGAATFMATPASADVCVDLYLEVNAQVLVDQAACVPTEA